MSKHAEEIEVVRREYVAVQGTRHELAAYMKLAEVVERVKREAKQ